MYTLSIDTSYYTSVLISIDAKVISYAKDNAVTAQSETIALLLQKVLEDANITYNDLSTIVVTVGPGSFTGIRVGISAANAIKLANENIKTIGVQNFDIMHGIAVKQVKKYDYSAVIIHAIRDECFIKVFDNNQNVKIEPKLYKYDEIKKVLQDLGGTLVCIGSGIIHCYESLENMNNLVLIPRFGYIDVKSIPYYVPYVMSNEEHINQNLEPFYYGSYT